MQGIQYAILKVTPCSTDKQNFWNSLFTIPCDMWWIPSQFDTTLFHDCAQKIGISTWLVILFNNLRLPQNCDCWSFTQYIWKPFLKKSFFADTNKHERMNFYMMARYWKWHNTVATLMSEENKASLTVNGSLSKFILWKFGVRMICENEWMTLNF